MKHPCFQKHNRDCEISEAKHGSNKYNTWVFSRFAGQAIIPY